MSEQSSHLHRCSMSTSVQRDAMRREPGWFVESLVQEREERGGVQREGEADANGWTRTPRSNRRTEGQPNKTFQGGVR
jgi:hypothetical protein